jgi:hypothetical protein
LISGRFGESCGSIERRTKDSWHPEIDAVIYHRMEMDGFMAGAIRALRSLTNLLHVHNSPALATFPPRSHPRTKVFYVRGCYVAVLLVIDALKKSEFQPSLCFFLTVGANQLTNIFGRMTDGFGWVEDTETWAGWMGSKRSTNRVHAQSLHANSAIHREPPGVWSKASR